jgi:Mrp family chromosome partitioning ATPase
LEPISYLRAPIRRWPVVVSVALVAMIVALLIPVGSGSAYPANTWQAPSHVGLTPPYSKNGLGSKVGAKQIEFYAQAPAVIAAAAKAAGVPVTNSLRSDIVVTKVKKSGGHGAILEVSVLQPTKHGAASLTNAFVTALASYTQIQLVNQHKEAIAKQQAYIANLQTALNNLPKKTPPSTTTTTTIAPVPPKVIIKKKKKKADRVVHESVHAVRSVPAAAALSAAIAATQPISPHVELVDTASTTSTTLPAVPGGTSASTTLPPAGSTGPGSSTPTTLSLPNKTIVEVNRVLSTELGSALAGLARLDSAGTTPSGIRVITLASPDRAVKLNTSPPPLSNDFLRALLGLAIGVLLGVGATWLLDAFDKRLRTSKRAEEVFGLPVIVEIPAPKAKTMPTIPVVDVIVDPYSPASEAYRRLHVAILTAPPVTWVKRGYSYQEDLLELAALRSSQEVLVGASARTGAAPGPSDAVTGRLPVPVGSRSVTAPHRSRFSILVTAPTDEPTRSLVVVNLAAVFAEAGDRVLVATTGGMRSSIVSNSKLAPNADEGPYSDLTAAELVANARPSQIPGVSSLALGQLFPNPSKLALNAPALVEAARDVVDVVLWEAPLLSTQDGTALLPAADLVVVIAEAWQTTVKDGLQSQRLLAQHRPPVLGLVMTNMRADHPTLSTAP